MRHFSMFAGAEGNGLGLKGELVGVSEINKYASMVLKYHYPDASNYGDCSKINWSDVPDFDILTGGSPCQDFSIAGKREGIIGARSGLVWEFIRCLDEKRPRYFIWENVEGVMSSRSGWDFANIISAFSESGYALWWQLLNAKYFGVPQNRERIFVVGFRDGSPREVFFEQDAGGQNIRVLTEHGQSQGARLYDTDGVATTQNSGGGGSRCKDGVVLHQRNGGWVPHGEERQEKIKHPGNPRYETQREKSRTWNCAHAHGNGSLQHQKRI